MTPQPLSSADPAWKARLVTVLVDEVGPALQLDGAAIEVLDLSDGVLRLRLGDVCAGCPSTIMVILMGLEQELRQRFPEIEYLEAVP